MLTDEEPSPAPAAVCWRLVPVVLEFQHFLWPVFIYDTIKYLPSGSCHPWEVVWAGVRGSRVATVVLWFSLSIPFRSWEVVRGVCQAEVFTPPKLSGVHDGPHLFPQT